MSTAFFVSRDTRLNMKIYGADSRVTTELNESGFDDAEEQLKH